MGRGYGDPSAEAVAAQALCAEIEGLHLETTYTGKCLAALLAVGGQPPYRGTNLLFWNTYSSVDPAAGVALPDYRELPVEFHRFFESS